MAVTAPAFSPTLRPVPSGMNLEDLDDGLCYLPSGAGPLSCFFAEVNAKRNRSDSFNSDVSTACSVAPFNRQESPGIFCSKNASESVAEDLPEEWTKSRVIALAGELLQGFLAPDFQKQLKGLLAKSSNYMVVPGRMELALAVQREVLPEYGFPGTIEGIEAMLEAVSPFMVDQEVNNMMIEIDIALGLPRKNTDQRVQLSRSQVLALAGELLDGFRMPAFQEVLQSVLKSCSPHNIALERTELAMSVQSKVLPKYGFPGNSNGVFLMLDAMSPWASDFTVASVVSAIDESLGLPAGTTISSLE